MQLVLRTHHCFERAAAKYIAAWRKTGRGVVAAFVPGKTAAPSGPYLRHLTLPLSSFTPPTRSLLRTRGCLEDGHGDNKQILATRPSQQVRLRRA
jgi:hypothetical protein